MGYFVKKTLVLRACPCGLHGVQVCKNCILKADAAGTDVKFELSAPWNVVENGQFVLAVCNDEGKHLFFSLKDGLDVYCFNSRDFSIENGICAAILKGVAPVAAVAFGNGLKQKIKQSELARYYERECSEKQAQDQAENFTDKAQELWRGERGKNVGCTELKSGELLSQFEIYDDELIATENYYQNFACGDAVQLKEREDEQFIHIENDAVKTQPRAEQAQEECFNGACLHEAQPRSCQAEERLRIRGEIEELFGSFAECEGLSRVIPCSKWIRINYDAGRYYIVGVVYECSVEKYIVYGVEGVYGNAPKGFADRSVFIPSSLYDINGRGYWCIFQNLGD